MGPFDLILSFYKKDINLIWLTQEKLIWVFFGALERYIKRIFFHDIYITLILIIDQFKFQINNLCMLSFFHDLKIR